MPGEPSQMAVEPCRPAGWHYVFGALLICVVLVGLASYNIVQTRAHSLESATVAARSTASLLENSIGEAIAKSDLTLQVLADQLQQHADWMARDKQTLSNLIELLQRPQPELDHLRVHDAEGFARLGAGVRPEAPINFADRDYFQQPRDNPEAGLVIGRPVMGRITKKWALAISRRFNTPDGRFGGVAAAVWSADSFGKLMKGFALGPHGEASLYHRDLSLIYRYPPKEDWKRFAGEPNVPPQLKRLISDNGGEGLYVATSADGIERLSVVHRIRDLPLYVVVGVAPEDYLVQWRRNSLAQALIVIAMIALTALGSRKLYLGAQRLAESEARWHFALEGSAQGVFDWDIPAKKAYFSPQYKRLLGYEDREIGEAESEWTNRVHPQDLPGLLDAIQRHLSGLTPYAPSDFRMRCKDGTYRWISSRGVVVERTPEGQPLRMIGTISDITERREMEAQIRLLNTNLERLVSERTAALDKALLRLQLATNAASMGVWTWNFSTNRLDFDDRLNQWYEIPPDIRGTGLLYDVWLARLHPEDRAPIEAAAKRAIEACAPFSETFRIVLPGGQTRFIHAASVLEYDEAGNKVGMVGINRDITLQHTLEANLIAAKEAAEAAALTKSRFIANMSHEIRTPLNAMIGLSGVLMESDLNERQREQLRKIQLAGQVLLSVLNDILDHSKIEAGLLMLESAPLEIAQILERARAMFGEQAAQKNLRLEFQIDEDVPPVVMGDALRLQQVLSNLLGNALKFTATGRVEVKVHCLEKTEQHVMLKVEVTDTGIGLTAEEISRLFSPFVQADTSTTRKYGGTGLGLSIARRLVELMGGEIGVVSEPGKYSTFWFTLRAMLPDARVEMMPIAPTPVRHEVTAEQKTVDMDALLPQLKNLAEMLAGGKAKASEASAKIEKHLAHTELQAAFAPVARAVAMYDYELALENLEDLAKQKAWQI